MATAPTLRSVAHRGRNLVDTDVVIEPNQDISGVAVTFVDAPSGIRGHILEQRCRRRFA